MTKKIVILGSTGSIGTQSLEIVNKFPDRFKVTGLSAGSNADLIIKQAIDAGVKNIAVSNPKKDINHHEANIISGRDAELKLLDNVDYDIALNAIVGAAGLKASIKVLKSGKTLALANKESMVAGGTIINSLLKYGGRIIPVDSEHSAIFQCLENEKDDSVSKLILTASGGPFRGMPVESLKKVTVKDALKHPNWSMGAKITVDSATLMNKGLEVIEAHFLFGLDYDRIDILVHPQSIIHGMVVFRDGTVKALASVPNMRIPIGFALSYPLRLPLAGHNITQVKEFHRLDFSEPDFAAFRAPKLCYEAGRAGKTYPAVLSAANEVAVENFLSGKISFLQITDVVERVFEAHEPENETDLEAVLRSDSWARDFAEKMIERL